MGAEFASPTADEFALVYDAWLNSYRKSPFAGTVRNDMYYAVQRATIVNLLDRGARVTMVLAPVVEGINTARRAMGFAVTEPGILHYLYIKHDYRGQGFASSLLAHVSGDWDTKVYTHRTPACSGFLSPRGFKWDPRPARIELVNGSGSQSIGSRAREAHSDVTTSRPAGISS